MDTGRIGRRIAYWRERRGFTQGDFGRLMGKSRRWVQDLEGGQRQSDPRISVLDRAAEILRVPLEQLLTDSPPRSEHGDGPPSGVQAVLEALDQRGEPSVADSPPSLRDLRRTLTYCCEAFQACHYKALGKSLPALIVQAQYAAALAPSDRLGEAQALLSRVYQLTASFLHKYGKPTKVQAAVAADRALAASERSGDPVAMGAASRRVAKSLMHQGRLEAAAVFATTAARRLTDDLTACGPLGLSTLGMLYLNAAIALSGQERSTGAVREAVGLVDEAGEVASRQGGDRNEDWTAFGPTNVHLHRVDVLVRFEDGWSALDAAAGLDAVAFTGLTRERRAQHHMTIARASLLTRRKDEATQAVLAAERLAPEEVHGRAEAVSLVADLVGASAAPSGELRLLAHRCGLRA